LARPALPKAQNHKPPSGNRLYYRKARLPTSLLVEAHGARLCKVTSDSIRTVTEAKRKLQISSIELSKKTLQQVEDKLPSASAAQAAVICGILA
jgi:hypothetical protein